MDEYGQVGPDKPGYPGDVAGILAELTHGASVVTVKFAARSTMKHILLTTLFHTARPGGIPEGFGGKDALFVGLADGKADWFPVDPGTHWSYFASRLGQPFGDSDVDHPLADFITDLMLGLAQWAEATGAGIIRIPWSSREYEARAEDDSKPDIDAVEAAIEARDFLG